MFFVPVDLLAIYTAVSSVPTAVVDGLCLTGPALQQTENNMIDMTAMGGHLTLSIMYANNCS